MNLLESKLKLSMWVQLDCLSSQFCCLKSCRNNQLTYNYLTCEIKQTDNIRVYLYRSRVQPLL